MGALFRREAIVFNTTPYLRLTTTTMTDDIVSFLKVEVSAKAQHDKPASALMAFT